MHYASLIVGHTLDSISSGSFNSGDMPRVWFESSAGRAIGRAVGRAVGLAVVDVATVSTAAIIVVVGIVGLFLCIFVESVA
jgi:hypothetical protein